MAPLPPSIQVPNIEQAFVADRAMFWERFTNFSKYAIIAVVALLVLMWIFLA